MSRDWTTLILDMRCPQNTWNDIFLELLSMATAVSSPVALHDQTVTPDRLLSEAAWELWEMYPEHAAQTSAALKDWCAGVGPSGKAIFIIDALSLRELPFLLGGAQAHNVPIDQVRVTGSECPSTTGEFARALGLSSRSVLENNKKSGTFALFADTALHTDVVSLPFEDCTVPPVTNIVIWHTWLDDLIHLQKKLPDQITANASSVLQSDGFWGFVDRLRQGRSLVITSDHGYAVSKRFSSEVEDPDAIDILRKTFGASRYKAEIEPWQERFMPPTVMTHNGQHMIMGQRKWKVQGSFPAVCHGGMSLLEVAVPWVEIVAL